MFPAATQRLVCALSLALALGACGGEDSPSDTDGTSDEDKDAGSNADARRADGGTPKDDAGETKADSGPRDNDASSGDPKLDALKGTYLMRWDVLGTATSTHPITGGPLKIRSRLSTLVVAELSVEGDKLVSRERVCNQVAAQKCEEGCSKASTVVDSRTINELITKEQSREFTLDGDTLRGGTSVAQLGYDDSDRDAPAPTSKADERVWDIDTSNTVREGFLTTVSVTLSGGPIPIPPVECKAYGTQKYVSEFTLQLKDDGSLESPDMNLDLEGSEAPALGANNETCEQQSTMAKTPIDTQSARMVRYEVADLACPRISVFDSELPGLEPELDQQ